MTQIVIGDIEIGRHELRLRGVESHASCAKVAEMLRICQPYKLSHGLSFVVRAKFGNVEASSVFLHVLTITQPRALFKEKFKDMS